MESYNQNTTDTGIDSLIMNDSITIQSLMAHLGDQKIMRILWRGSRDGYGADKFHGRCDNKGKTLTVVQTTNGQVFGAFTDISWTSIKGYKSGSKQSFLFLVLEDKNTAIGKCRDTCCEVYHYSGLGPGFGGLAIYDNCDQNRDSWSILGYAYYTIEGF